MRDSVRRRQNIPALRAQAGSRARHFQIGPRIRIGGTLGKIGEGVKQNLGQVAKIAAYPVAMVNPALGAALAAGGRALHTNEGAAGLGDLALAGAKAYGAGKIGQGVFGKLTDGLGTIGSGSGALGGVANGTGLSLPGVLSGAQRLLGSGSGVPGTGGSGSGFGLEDLGIGALAAYQMKASADAAKKKDEYDQLAINQAKSNWDRGQVLRDQGLTGLTTRTPINLGATYSDPTNPMARPVITGPVSSLAPSKRSLRSIL